MLHGVGASDCKAGLAAQIYAGALLKRALLPLRGNLVVAATVSEERGGSPGLRHLLRETLPSLDVQPDYAVLGEPTALSLYYGHDGSATFEVLIEGPGHFQVHDATHAVFANFRGQFSRSPEPGAYEHQSMREPRFQQVPGFIVRGDQPLPPAARTERCGMMEQIKHEARSAAAWVARVAVDVVVRREEHQLYTKRTTILEQRVEPWSLDPFHPLVTRARQALAAAGCRSHLRQVAAAASGDGHRGRRAGQRVPCAGHRLRSRGRRYVSRAQRNGVGGPRE